MISGKINVNLIKKEKLFKGQKGKYLDIVLIETPNSQYGDYMIKQQGERGEDMPILGNAKNFQSKPKADTIQLGNLDDDSDDLPF